ncbi:sensor histidine kinase [Pelagicoccus mobilis]|uniref:histidine kinase n=1 Tax=Pelagicoccus mobilis TaxID=415221 RepID=A0A934RVB5_9BACT|nr:PAS domain-containing protein [Pelagicoccus mobilis]MBK1877063.1 PAS domain-containing protein [Pelagicoccus mobilis]
MESQSSPSKRTNLSGIDADFEALSLSGSWLYQENANEYHYSTGALRVLGEPTADVQQHAALEDLIDHSDREDWIHSFKTHQSGGETGRFITRVRDSAKRIEIAWRRTGGIVKGTICDLTRHLQLEEDDAQSRDFQMTALDAMPIRVFWKDLESNYLGCNKAFAKDAGLASPASVKGKTDYQLFSRSDADFFRKIDREVMNTGVSQERFIEPQTRSDGAKAWLRTSKVPLRRADGAVFGLLGTYEDITAEKERERRFALSHYSVDEVRSAIFWCNADGSFFYVNQTACEWLQYSRKELIGMFDFDINPSVSQSTWKAHWRELKKEGALEIESELRRKDGTSLPVEIHSNYVFIDNQEFKIAFVFDITQRKEAEEKVAEYQHNLEKLVEIRTEELRDTNRELESFAYSVSHDLRAPLRGIDGFGQALLEDYGHLLDDDGKHFLRRIRAGTQRMSSLIDDILQLSRIGRKEVSKRSINLSELLQKICSELQESNPQHQVQVQIDDDIQAQCDPDLMRVALENLLGNAWKYTSQREDAKVSVSTKRYDDAHVLCVEDNGTGFDMAYAGKLFAPFQRLHRPDEYEGNGIGLATVHRIANKHGGSVWAESAPDQGSRFYFRIPIQDPPLTPTPK